MMHRAIMQTYNMQKNTTSIEKKILGRLDRVMPCQIFRVDIPVAQSENDRSTFQYLYAVDANIVHKDFTVF